MSQDTRKDPRAKIVSLNVRYKSATVDEFIENHSHDVSRGGLYIKTSTPFAQGTLLKFEIRLSSDQPVIAGVGRVVWKREPSQAATDRPAGMGVKFIKIDDRSRALIERLVTTKEGAGSAFNQVDDEVTRVTPNASGAPRAIELPSLKPTVSGMPAVSAAMDSMGASSDALAAPRAPSMSSTSEASMSGGSSAGFFPSTNSEADMPPPQERTMMRQAAELLEEALKASGGSMAEVEQNPLFAGMVPPPGAAGAAQSSPPPEEPVTIGGFPTSSPGSPSLGTADVPATPDRAMMVETPAHRSANAERRPSSQPPPRMASDPPARVSRTSTRPVRATDLIAEGAIPKKSSAGIWALVLILAGAGGGAYAYQAGMLDEMLGRKAPPPAPTTPVATAAPPTTATTPSASAAIVPPTPSASGSAAPIASTAPSAMASAGASATPSAAISAAPAPAPVAVKPVEPKPKPVEPTVTAPPKPKPLDGDPAAAPTPTPAPKPKPKPAAKPKDDSDNPY